MELEILASKYSKSGRGVAFRVWARGQSIQPRQRSAGLDLAVQTRQAAPSAPSTPSPPLAAAGRLPSVQVPKSGVRLPPPDSIPHNVTHS